METKTVDGGRIVLDVDDLTTTFNEDANATVYMGTTPKGSPFAFAFTGKSVKAKFRYTFRDVDSREEYVNNWLDRVAKNREAQANARAKANEKAEEFQKSVKVGDIFWCGWGYSMSLNDWYQVVEKTASGKSVKVKKLAKKNVTSDGGFSGQETAIPNEFVWAEPKTYRLLDECIKISSYSWARLWDGQPKHYDHMD